ncbi:hypothetical protein OROGR_029556 [Orobanche gracilis]
MGSSLSTENESGNGRPGLGDIPESCVACAFLHLSPPEICNLARLNRAFRGAASSDAVWETKLPSNYHHLLDLLSHPDVHENLTKKDIFALLSRPLPFEDDNKLVVWVDKFSGRVCMSISAKSRFNVVAYLQQIWWFEVDGSIKFPFPPDVYTLSFRIHLGRFSRRLGRRVSNFDHTHGWEIKPVRFEFSTSDGQQALSECFLDEPQQDDGGNNSYNTSHKRGCWIDYKVGEFIVGQPDSETEVRFSMKQIDCTHSKGGLYVDSVSIIPVELRARKGRGVLK